MRTDTQTIVLDGDRDHIFRFIADAENLPRWAVGFCRSIVRDGTGWIVRTAEGEVGLRMTTNAENGVIDFHMIPTPGVEVTAFSRVVSAPGGALFAFTQVQFPGMPDEVFAAQVITLGEELEVLRHVVRAQAACPA
jgi:hypothetical protein